jgi:hypothetical protein
MSNLYNLSLSTVKTKIEARIFESYKHLELDRYTCQELAAHWTVYVFFTDGSYRRFIIDDHVYVQGTGRFRNRKTQKLLIEPGLYNNPTYIALPIA